MESYKSNNDYKFQPLEPPLILTPVGYLPAHPVTQDKVLIL